MRPVLFSIGDFPIYAYSFFVALAYIGALSYGFLEARRLKQDPVHAIDLSIVIFVASIVGSRLLFVIVDYRRYLEAPLDVFKLWQGGLVFYGGLILAAIASVVFIRRRGLELGQWADLCAPTAMIALGIGRIGCFLGGCCYGKFSPGLFWGVIYPLTHPSATLGLSQVPVHPTPLYESLAALAIFGVLMIVKRRKRFEGQVFFLMVLLYAIARFILEFYRADPRGQVPLLGLSTSQAISAVAGGAAAIALVVAFLRAPRPAGAAAASPGEAPGRGRGEED